jgi:hypothetical protein
LFNFQAFAEPIKLQKKDSLEKQLFFSPDMALVKKSDEPLGEGVKLGDGELKSIEFGTVYTMDCNEREYAGEGTISLQFEDAGDDKAIMKVKYDFDNIELHTDWMTYPSESNPTEISLADGSSTQVTLGMNIMGTHKTLGVVTIQGKEFQMDLDDDVKTSVEDLLSSIPQKQLMVNARQVGNNSLEIKVSTNEDVPLFIKKMQIVDMNGSVVPIDNEAGRHTLEGGGILHLTIGNWSTGIYFLTIETDDGQAARHKFPIVK